MADQFGGGMVALVPSEADRARLAVSVGGEDPDELHLTLTYLGPDAEEIDQQRRAAITAAVASMATRTSPVDARVFGHATFNPDGHDDREPCAVYLIGDTTALSDLKAAFDPYASAAQHAPYIPHVTAGYGLAAVDLSYTGPVTFDALRLAIGDEHTDYPLTGTEETPVETKREISPAKREKLAKTPKAMNDGSYPIENVGDLKLAISAYGRADEAKRPDLRAHIVRNAKRLNATNMLPKNWSETPAAEKKAMSFATARDPFTAGVLLGLAGLEPDAALETKAGPPGATFPSPDPGATKLREYWVHGDGAAKIKWGVAGDFDRCVTHLSEHVGERAKGLCNIYHRAALHLAPGQEHKSTEGLELWVPDSEAAGGWRAYAPFWVVPDMPAEEVKAAPVIERDDSDVLGALDDYEKMLDTVQVEPTPDMSTEEIYDEAIAADIPWELEPGGELENPTEDTVDGDDDTYVGVFVGAQD